MDPNTIEPTVAINVAFGAWFSVMGGCIGSFLNVVIHRLPAGMSLAHPSSHCPKCNHPIRWHDNLPVLGWLLLRGRCRDCRASISARYPTVEALTAAIFLGLWLVEGATLGANLPPRGVPVVDGVIYPLASFPQAVGWVVYHALALSTLIGAAGIAIDSHRVPWRLFLPAWIAGAIAPLAWPHLHPVAAWGVSDGLLAGLVDTSAAVAAGLAIAWTTRRFWSPERRTGYFCAIITTSLFLGWQAGILLSGATLLLHALDRLLRPKHRVPGSLLLAVLFLAWVVAWRVLW